MEELAYSIQSQYQNGFYHPLEYRNNNTLKPNDIQGSFWLTQHVRVPSHTNGNTLDLVVSRDDDNFVGNVTVNSMIPDHAVVHIKLSICKPGLPKEKVTDGKYRGIDITEIPDLVISAHSTVNNLVEQYNVNLTYLIWLPKSENPVYILVQSM